MNTRYTKRGISETENKKLEEENRVATENNKSDNKSGNIGTELGTKMSGQDDISVSKRSSNRGSHIPDLDSIMFGLEEYLNNDDSDPEEIADSYGNNSVDTGVPIGGEQSERGKIVIDLTGADEQEDKSNGPNNDTLLAKQRSPVDELSQSPGSSDYSGESPAPGHHQALQSGTGRAHSIENHDVEFLDNNYPHEHNYHNYNNYHNYHNYHNYLDVSGDAGFSQNDNFGDIDSIMSIKSIDGNDFAASISTGPMEHTNTEFGPIENEPELSNEVRLGEESFDAHPAENEFELSRESTSIGSDEMENKDVEVQPAEDVEAQPAEDVEVQPAKDVEAQPAKEVEAQPAEEVEAQPAKEVEAQPTEDAESEKYIMSIEDKVAEVVRSMDLTQEESSIDARSIPREPEVSKESIGAGLAEDVENNEDKDTEAQPKDVDSTENKDAEASKSMNSAEEESVAKEPEVSNESTGAAADSVKDVEHENKDIEAQPAGDVESSEDMESTEHKDAEAVKSMNSAEEQTVDAHPVPKHAAENEDIEAQPKDMDATEDKDAGIAKSINSTEEETVDARPVPKEPEQSNESTGAAESVKDVEHKDAAENEDIEAKPKDIASTEDKDVKSIDSTQQKTVDARPVPKEPEEPIESTGDAESVQNVENEDEAQPKDVESTEDGDVENTDSTEANTVDARPIPKEPEGPTESTGAATESVKDLEHEDIEAQPEDIESTERKDAEAVKSTDSTEQQTIDARPVPKEPEEPEESIGAAENNDQAENEDAEPAESPDVVPAENKPQEHEDRAENENESLGEPTEPTAAPFENKDLETADPTIKGTGETNEVPTTTTPKQSEQENNDEGTKHPLDHQDNQTTVSSVATESAHLTHNDCEGKNTLPQSHVVPDEHPEASHIRSSEEQETPKNAITEPITDDGNISRSPSASSKNDSPVPDNTNLSGQTSSEIYYTVNQEPQGPAPNSASSDIHPPPPNPESSSKSKSSLPSFDSETEAILNGLDNPDLLLSELTSQLENEPVYIFTSLAGGGFHMIPRTNRLTTILQANRITFSYRDLGTDPEARSLWKSHAAGKQLPGLVRGSSVVGNWQDVEDANEDYRLRDLLYSL